MEEAAAEAHRLGLDFLVGAELSANAPGKIVERLRAHGHGLTVEDVLAKSGEGVPTRAHVGRALVSGGWVRDTNEAFRRFIGRGQPAFVEKMPTPPAAVIDLVRSAGGITILAHPGTDFTESEIAGWLDAGLDGVEILHPRNGAAVRRALTRMAERRGLLRGGGSDWHGTDSGAPPGSQNVPAAWMAEIRARCGA
jgi:predicted metal-dependent phosphoesterase TrpH